MIWQIQMFSYSEIIGIIPNSLFMVIKVDMCVLNNRRMLNQVFNIFRLSAEDNVHSKIMMADIEPEIKF